MNRQQIVDSGHLFFQNDSDKTDLLNPEITQECLINWFSIIIKKGYHVVTTAVKTSHHDDSGLGLHCHFNGYCADLWPLTGPNPTAYIDQSSEEFRQFLKDAQNEYLYQTGLTPDCYTESNIEAAGSTVYLDDGGSHVHIGTK
jgi:hypothetical protein